MNASVTFYNCKLLHLGAAVPSNSSLEGNSIKQSEAVASCPVRVCTNCKPDGCRPTKSEL